jgi:hypothetical protein
MIEVGIGPRQVNKLVTALGIPGVSAKTLKKREREIQKPLADLATMSGHQAVQEEIEKTRDNGGPRVTKNAAVIDKIVQYFT